MLPRATGKEDPGHAYLEARVDEAEKRLINIC